MNPSSCATASTVAVLSGVHGKYCLDDVLSGMDILQLQLLGSEDSRIPSALAVDVLGCMQKTLHVQLVTDGAQPGKGLAWEEEFGMVVAGCHDPSRRVVIPVVSLYRSTLEGDSLVIFWTCRFKSLQRMRQCQVNR